MICSTSNRLTRAARRSFRTFALFLGIAGVTSPVFIPAVAQASPRPALSAAATCGKVSAASVSAVVGFSVPAPTAYTDHLKPTKQNYEISAVLTSCTYGSETSLAALGKTVSLSYEVTSRPLTAAELKNAIAEAQKIKMKLVPYPGLGIPAFYFTFTEGGLTAQGITGLTGTKEYGAFVYTKTVSKSELAALVRLAERL